MALEKSGHDSDDENSILAKAPKKRSGKKERHASQEKDKTSKIQVGSNVKLDGAGTVGTVVELSGKNAIVVFGNLKTTVKVERLSPTLAQPGGSKKASVSMQTIDSGYERQLKFKQEIDVRGMRGDEAVQAVTYFIDDAIRFSVSRVRILHGTGTGALRQSIRQYLSTIPGVASYHDEDVRFGGAGITVVNLK